MAKIEGYTYCCRCAHICHCKKDKCETPVCIGMSDKTAHCGCGECKCKQPYTER